MQKLTENRAKELIEGCTGKTIAVIGDVMVDRYFWGAVSRISPESPVPVVDLEHESFHLGGAANVANNLRSLGVTPLLCGIIGKDRSGERFLSISKDNELNTAGLYIDEKRPTTVKTRIIGNNQQIARLDREVRKQITEKGIKHIINTISNYKDIAGIVFEDYNKGAINKSLISRVLSHAEANDIPVFVDPKSENFFHYKNVTVFKPNLKEALNALHINYNGRESVIKAGTELLQKLSCKNLLLTLGKDGMMLFSENHEIHSVPTRARHVADVSGAGDTAIATLAAAVAGGASVSEAASLANYAAGIVCEMPGIVSVTVDELLLSVRRNHINGD